jgi:hygromycin-B 7''-O-kinase
MIWPTAQDDAGWDALLDDDATLTPGVADVLARHGLGNMPIQRYDSGSLPVYAVGPRHVLKLYPPSGLEHAQVEARVLQAVHGRLPIATPEPLAADVHEGWPYLLMTQLPGERLVDAWPRLTPADRDRLAEDFGATVAALHAIDTAPLAGLPPAWDNFIAAQRATAAQRQRQRGLDEKWVERIPEFLDQWMPPPAPRHVLLHTELMREHLTVVQAGHGWQLAGVFDFEPAMLGDAEYDFASVGLFVSCGDARFLRRTLSAYGYTPDALNDALPCRMMAWALLHRYSKLRWYLERLPVPGATTLEQLAARWWALH